MEDRSATPRSALRADARGISKKLINFCKYRIANRRPDEIRKRSVPIGELLDADMNAAPGDRTALRARARLNGSRAGLFDEVRKLFAATPLARKRATTPATSHSTWRKDAVKRVRAKGPSWWSCSFCRAFTRPVPRVISQCDWIIDLGPGAGDEGGKIGSRNVSTSLRQPVREFYVGFSQAERQV
jgi:excinuclease UvrABC ATPase subunit